MSWHTIAVKPRGGPPQYIWLDDGWYKIDSVGAPYISPEGVKDYRVMVQRDNVILRQMENGWYIEGSGPDDKYY